MIFKPGNTLGKFTAALFSDISLSSSRRQGKKFPCRLNQSPHNQSCVAFLTDLRKSGAHTGVCVHIIFGVCINSRQTLAVNLPRITIELLDDAVCSYCCVSTRISVRSVFIEGRDTRK